MKIIRLTAENVKRLKAVEITPDGTVQVITCLLYTSDAADE